MGFFDELVSEVKSKDVVCGVEFFQLMACFSRHEKSLEKLRDQYPDKFEGFRRRFGTEPPWLWDYDEKYNARDCIQFCRGAREYLEQQLLFGPISFDPLLYSFGLYPLAAVVALAVSETCTAPLSRITILSQVEGGATTDDDRRKMTILQQAARIIEEQGGSDHEGYYEGLWRGHWVFVAHRLAFYGIHLFAYTNFKALLEGSLPSMNPAGVAFMSGGLAAFTAASISYPLDTLKTHIAIQTSKEYMGAWRTYRKIRRDGGHRSLYAGMSASLLRVVPSMAISFSVYEPLSLIWGHLRPEDSLFTTTLVCGSIAGLAAAAATYPLDVVQRRLQTEKPNNAAPAAGGGGSDIARFRGMFGQIVREEGVGGLYRGIQAHCLKTVVDHALAYMTYEIAKKPLALLRLLRVED